jgi:hypothetical protein
VLVELSYPGANAHAPYCHLWSVWVYRIFPRSHKGYHFRGKKGVLNTKFVFWFSLQRLSETYFILRRIYLYYLHVQYPLFLTVINENLVEIFQKYSNMKFHETPSSESRVVPCGQTERRTDKHDEANSRFPEFCERV